jgi:ribosome-associated protein
MSITEKTVKIKELPIRLGQFLKLADLVQDGFEAKLRIQNGEVMVNSLTETRRGRQLNHHDKITLDGETWIVDLDI